MSAENELAGGVEYIDNDPVIFVRTPLTPANLELDGESRDLFVRELGERVYEAATRLWNKKQQEVTAQRARRQEARLVAEPAVEQGSGLHADDWQKPLEGA